MVKSHMDKLKAGFGKVDITPRVGVQLAGFGPYLNRHSIAVRDRLWARAIAVNCRGKTLLIVSCDIVGINSSITEKARKLVSDKTGVDGSCIMICSTHTHSGPSSNSSFGWGAGDEPYIELLPYRIARACKGAVSAMEDVVAGYKEVSCEGIGLNRVYDKDAPPLEEVLKDDWRPAKPELTDTVCKVITFHAGEHLKGFISSFGCHPVTCCSGTRYIHGDYAGVATNNLERENPGSVGMFLQGASGDVNSCVVHKPEQEALLALDIVAARFANCVRKGIKNVEIIKIDSIKSRLQKMLFKRTSVSLADLKKQLEEHEKVLDIDEITDADLKLRSAVLYINALRKFIYKLESGREAELNPMIELQLFKIGPLTLFGAPFEVFQAIKNELAGKSTSEIPILVSHANGSFGYAPSNDQICLGGYADTRVPIIKHYLPYADIHNELVSGFLEMEKELLL